MYKSVIFLVFGFFLFVSADVLADEEIFWGDVYILLLGDDDLSQSDRKIIAKRLNSICDHLNRKIPAISPNERRWINSEYEAGRIDNLGSSPEMAKQSTKAAFIDCATHSSGVLDAASEAREAILWVRLTRSMLTGRLLERMKILEAEKVVRFDQGEIGTASLFARAAAGILGNIITPLLLSGLSEGG
jgi:hypothetical protein